MIGSRDSAALPEQGDLFEERGNWQWPDTSQHDLGVENLEGLSDKDLVEKTAKATLSNVDLLCAQIVERGLGDIAVPGLVALWNRFKGFGIATPLPEQKLALETLRAIGNEAAKKRNQQDPWRTGLARQLAPVCVASRCERGLEAASGTNLAMAGTRRTNSPCPSLHPYTIEQPTAKHLGNRVQRPRPFSPTNRSDSGGESGPYQRKGRIACRVPEKSNQPKDRSAFNCRR